MARRKWHGCGRTTTQRSLIFSSTINSSILEYVHNRPTDPLSRSPSPTTRHRILGSCYCLVSFVRTACSIHVLCSKLPRLSQFRLPRHAFKSCSNFHDSRGCVHMHHGTLSHACMQHVLVEWLSADLGAIIMARMCRSPTRARHWHEVRRYAQDAP